MLFQMVWLISDPKANQRLKAASEAGSANAWQALGALSRTVSQGFRAWSAAGARRRAQAGAVRELRLMSDRALSDIGIDRSEIHRVAGDLIELRPGAKGVQPCPETSWAPPAWFSRGTALAVGRALRQGQLVAKQREPAPCGG